MVSNDLNPIERVWDQLKQRLDDCTQPSHDLAGLRVTHFFTKFELWFMNIKQNQIAGAGGLRTPSVIEGVKDGIPLKSSNSEVQCSLNNFVSPCEVGQK